MEGTGEEARSDEVPKGSEVWDGRIVGVDAEFPHPMHHHNRHVQQHKNLMQIRKRNSEDTSQLRQQ